MLHCLTACNAVVCRRITCHTHYRWWHSTRNKSPDCEATAMLSTKYIRCAATSYDTMIGTHVYVLSRGISLWWQRRESQESYRKSNAGWGTRCGSTSAIIAWRSRVLWATSTLVAYSYRTCVNVTYLVWNVIKVLLLLLLWLLFCEIVVRAIQMLYIYNTTVVTRNTRTRIIVYHLSYYCSDS